RLRACEPQRRGRAWRLPRRARHDRGRSARRILRSLLLRGLFHRPRRHEARSHGVQAAAEATAGGEEKEEVIASSGAIFFPLMPAHSVSKTRVNALLPGITRSRLTRLSCTGPCK